MKTIKTYLTNLPKGVKWIFSVNISIYLLCLITLYGFNYKLQNYLGFYPTYSENFNPLQLITDMFTHSTDVNHIFFNMLFFLIFAPFVENKIGEGSLPNEFKSLTTDDLVLNLKSKFEKI